MKANDDNALIEINSRISAMERRLRNARAARDTYIGYLKNKYPLWKPSLPTYDNSSRRRDEPLVDRLTTSQYHWDIDHDLRPRHVYQPDQSRLYHQIPLRGPMLESDVKRTRRRLEEISAHLRTVRETRMSLTSEEYFRTRIPAADDDIMWNESSLTAVKKRLAEMTLNTFDPPQTPTMEQMEEARIRAERDKMIEDIRAGKIPSILQEETPVVQSQLTLWQQQNIPQHPIMETKTEPSASNISNTAINNNQPPKVDESAHPRRTITFSSEPVVAPTIEEVKTAPTKKPQASNTPTTSSYSQMMSKFGRTPSSDSEDDNKPLQQSKVEVPQQKPETEKTAPTNKPSMGFLSQYLSSNRRGSTSSSGEEKMKTITKKTPMPQDTDSDDDFFK